jgi:hypothetical protein
MKIEKKLSNNNVAMLNHIITRYGCYELQRIAIYISIHYYGLIIFQISTHSFNHYAMIIFLKNMVTYLNDIQDINRYKSSIVTRCINDGP